MPPMSPTGSTAHIPELEGVSDSRQRILIVAIDLFNSQGFGGTGVREIADIAQMNVASIYHYFPSKEAILFAIIEDTYRAVYEPARSLVQEPHPAEVLIALTRHHIILHCDKAKAAAVSDRELGSLKMPTHRRALELRDSYEKLWDDLLRKGEKDGLFRIEDVELVRIAILTMCSQVAAWYRPTGRVSADELARFYAKLVLRLVAYRQPPG